MLIINWSAFVLEKMEESEEDRKRMKEKERWGKKILPEQGSQVTERWLGPQASATLSPCQGRGLSPKEEFCECQ